MSLKILSFNFISFTLFRSTLVGQDRISFVHSATNALKQYEFKFTYDCKTELDNVYSLALRVRKFREDCIRYDMHDVFETLPFLDDGKLADNAEPISLFDNYKDISLENVRKSTRLYYEHASEDYIIENLVWSGEKLLNSCEAELRDIILTKALFLPQKEVGGPVYFKIMMEVYNEVNSTPPSSPLSKTRMELKGLKTSLSLANLEK